MRLHRIIAAGVSVSLAACGGSEPAAPVAVASVTLSPPSASLVAGSTQAFAATARGASGEALSGRAVTWASGNSEVATIDGSGLLTAIAPGASTVTATSGGKSGTAIVTVLPVPVASIVVAPLASPLAVAGSATLSVTVRDARGQVVSGRSITWATSNGTVALVNNTGVVTGVSPGSATITATSEGVTGSVVVEVLPGAAEAPSIASVSPASVAPGGLLTITGTGFEPLAAANAVTIRGVAAIVTAASPTSLTVTAPCVSSGEAGVRVSARGTTSARASVGVVVTRRSLAVGESAILTSNAPSLCNELVTASGNARYLVTVFSASTSQNTLVDFELGGNTPDGAATQAVVRAAAASAGAAYAPMPVALREEAGRQATRDARHWDMLERNRRDYETLMARSRASRVSDSRTSSATAPASARVRAALPEIGEQRPFFFTFNGGCADTTRVVHGRAIYVGTRAIVWEDTANALQSTADAALAGYYERLGRIFDIDQYESVKRTFGDPLLRDAVTDNDGRVHMIFTERVNGSGAAAYVTSCDQFPTSTSAGSNFGQYFYGFVPTTAGSNINNSTFPDGWFNFMARTVVHEVKHIASLSARVANNSPGFEQSWLEEGTARHAEELWVRESLHRVPWKGNSGFGTATQNGVYCDFLPTEGTCLTADPLRRPSFGMRRQFNETRDKLVQPWNWSPYGDGAGQTGAVFYNTAWSLVRYTIDRYATSDAAFFSRLINATNSGVANLSAIAGVPMDQLIGGWGLALYTDDYPGLSTANADLQFPTWNMRSIYAGLNASPTWQSRFPTAYPVQPLQLAFGAFTSRVTGLRGGAHAYFELSGAAAATQLLSLRGVTGAPSANLRIAIARLP